MAVLTSLRCAWAELQLADGKWVNATIAIIASSPAALTLTAAAAPLAGAGAGPPLASRYGWGAVPMLSVYDKRGRGCRCSRGRRRWSQRAS